MIRTVYISEDDVNHDEFFDQFEHITQPIEFMCCCRYDYNRDDTGDFMEFEVEAVWAVCQKKGGLKHKVSGELMSQSEEFAKRIQKPAYKALQDLLEHKKGEKQISDYEAREQARNDWR